LAPQASAPKAFAALQVPGYGMYMLGSGLAMTADSIEHVISYWMVFQKFQSPALAGYAVISHWLPFLLFSVSAGALADRLDPRRMIQAGMLLFIGCSLGSSFGMPSSCSRCMASPECCGGQPRSS
jgi:MFS family permease